MTTRATTAATSAAGGAPNALVPGPAAPSSLPAHGDGQERDGHLALAGLPASAGHLEAPHGRGVKAGE